MTSWQIGLLIVGIAIFDAWLIRALIRSKWTPFAARHPARPPLAHAERRNFQSFNLGLFNLTWSIHVAADADSLHLIPARPFRWLGMERVSMKWDDVDLLPGKRFGGRRAIRIGVGQELIGPAWCLGMAEAREGRGGGGTIP